MRSEPPQPKQQPEQTTSADMTFAATAERPFLSYKVKVRGNDSYILQNVPYFYVLN
jgi:hypothetical protein